MDFKFKLFLRIMAACGFIATFGHNAEIVNHVFGLTLDTISFLTVLLMWYTFVYCYMFHGYGQVLPLCKRTCHYIQLAILGINLSLIAYGGYLHTRGISAEYFFNTSYSSFFSIFPELVIYAIKKFFD